MTELDVAEKVANAQRFVREHLDAEWSGARTLAYDVEYLADLLRLARADLDRAVTHLSHMAADA